MLEWSISVSGYASLQQKSKNRDFQVGELILKKVNPAVDVGNLDARWEEPYKVIRKVSSGALYLEWS